MYNLPRALLQRVSRVRERERERKDDDDEFFDGGFKDGFDENDECFVDDEK